jgi:methionyl-tRNA synthetase
MAHWNSEGKVAWPARAVVTAGMPYGNKALHFGHIGGVFVPADAFARFLRDRIGAKNVRFVSGTDCYGSPINEGYRKAVEAGTFEGTIEDYVMNNHNLQVQALEAFDVNLDIFEGSGIGHAGDVHAQVTAAVIEGLHEQGFLKLDSTLQFYDTQANTFLNGRQVSGHCPVQGCKSEQAYADECELGHQYSPVDLINPVSSLTGTVPEMRPVDNWYFDLPAFSDFLKSEVARMQADENTRSIVPTTISEFLVPPVIYVKCEAYDAYAEIANTLPKHVYRDAPRGKQSFEIEFESIEARDAAREILAKANIRFRTSKALVPFRITGNIEWGVPAPVIDGVSGLTVWCWPESLWAPISFTIACNDQLGQNRDCWQDFWCSNDAEIYQFIGQDNLYFYGIAQSAMWEALGNRGVFGGCGARALKQSKLIANHHLLFGKTKASSSGAVKPPRAPELLEHYTPEQLRAHFLALGLAQKSVPFSPKPFDPQLTDDERADTRVADPALKEAALLNNVFNRLARSCFYEAQKNFDGKMPVMSITPSVVERTQEALRQYDAIMAKVEFHSIMQLADEFIRYANKYWADEIKRVVTQETESGASAPTEAHAQVLADSFYLLRACALMMHPVVPHGCNLICEYMQVDPANFFSWDTPFEGVAEFCTPADIKSATHAVKELPPRFDFFPKHESQFKKK